MAQFDAVILAAGLSRRMGAENKLLLNWHGAPLIAHVTRTYLAALGGAVTVVTGHQAEHVTAALAGLPVSICHNADFASGQNSSVVAALSQPTSADATLLGLGDQPLLTTDNLHWLMSMHHALDPAKITIPGRDGARGNPIVIPAALRPPLLENPSAPGCRRFTRDHPELVTMAQTTEPGFFTDIDTRADYLALKERSGGPHEKAS